MDSFNRIEKALSLATDTRVFRMGHNALSEAPEVFKSCFPGRKAMVLADCNTWPVMGEPVYRLLVAAGVQTDYYIIGLKEFHAEWRFVEMAGRLIEGRKDLARDLEQGTDYAEGDANASFRDPSEDFSILVSAGSGVINDLCKLSSHHHGQSYLSLPTAASVDGYSSFGASISYHNSKQTFSCPAPVAIVADIDVIAAAPKAMTAAGYADLAAKIPAAGEWLIADFVGSEPVIPAAYNVLQDHLDGFLSRPEAVAAGDPDAVADIFEGLTLSGIAMQAARSSRPASCCDHLFSHILDMTHHRYRGKGVSHGFQVAIGTMTMCAVFDLLLKTDLSGIDVEKCVSEWPSLEQEQQRALDVFRNFPSPRLGYEQITLKYDPAPVVREQLVKVKKGWRELRAALEAKVYPFARMQRLMRLAGAPSDPADIGVERSAIRDMFPLVQLMRYRFNVLDLARRGGFYEKITAPLFGRGGVWEIV